MHAFVRASAALLLTAAFNGEVWSADTMVQLSTPVGFQARWAE